MAKSKVPQSHSLSKSRGQNGNGARVPLQVHCTISVEVLPDFTLDDQGSLIILHPVTSAAREWVNEHIGQENGYQPMWPTVLIEHHYADDVIAGAQRDGLTVVRS